MPSDNRGRITIEQPGKPRLYQHQDLPGWEIVGTVTRGGETGALVRNLETGTYAQANAGAIRSLDQRKVKLALGGDGASPAPSDVAALRTDAGLTQTQAAQLLHTSLRSYQQWEAGDRKMHPAFWELFRLKLAMLNARTVTSRDQP